MGSPGPSGPAGAPGSRILVTPVAPGSTCPSGGTRIDVGVDVNGNGLLDPNEIQQTATVCSTGVVDAGPSVPDAGLPDGGPTTPDATTPDSGPDCGMHGTFAGSYLLQVHQETRTVYDDSCEPVVDTYDGPSTMVLTPFSWTACDDPARPETCGDTMLQFAVSLAGTYFEPLQANYAWDPANTPNVVTLSSSGYITGYFPETTANVSFTIDLTSGVVTDVVMQSDSHGLSCHEQIVRVTGSGARDCTPAPPVQPLYP